MLLPHLLAGLVVEAPLLSVLVPAPLGVAEMAVVVAIVLSWAVVCASSVFLSVGDGCE